MSRIEIVRGSELGAGDSTQGIIRRKVFESEHAIVSQSQVAPGVVSGWHHHGTRQLCGFIVSGSASARVLSEKKGNGRLECWRLFSHSAGASSQRSESKQRPRASRRQ